MAQRNPKTRADKKKGVVLLIIVTLLTLFIMIGVTLSLLASNYRNSGEQIRSAGTYGDQPERETDFGLNQVLFGASQLSALSGHSLLEDLYGRDSYRGVVGTLAPPNQGRVNGGQAIQFQLDTTNTASPVITLDHYSGRVLTFLSGDAVGLSTRVMAWYPDASGVWQLVIEAPASDLPIAINVAAGDQFLINGAPFNGTGAGYNPSTYNLDASITITGMNDPSTGLPIQFPMALLPHFAGYSTVPAIDPSVGGLDESYDAPDYQDVWLAMMPPELGQGTGVTQITLLPSFHRPDLVLFWFNFLMGPSPPSPIAWNAGTSPQARPELLHYPYGRDGIPANADDQNTVSYMEVSLAQRVAIVDLKRAFIFRPLHEDHPNFGGNPNFEPDYLVAPSGVAPAPYDVDNNGDGIADSVWIDPQLPIVTARDGRKYKRMFAFLIMDLDNRINVNVQGNLWAASNANARASTPLSNFPVAGTDLNFPTQVSVSRGIGFGPAESDFAHIFSTAAAYNQLLSRRYGTDGVPGAAGDDFASRIKTIGIPDDHLNQYSSYTTPPDVWGRGALALDYFGTPAWWDQTQVGSSERTDDPYEVQFDWRRARADSPYTIAELEPLLRYHDRDIRGMQSRLAAGALQAQFASSTPGSLGLDQVRRALITTHSASLPVPQVLVPMELRTDTNSPLVGATSLSIMDYYHRRLPAAANKPDELRKMVPFEFRHGRLFNINREFGNGVNDASVSSPSGMPPPYNLSEDNRGVVDDPGESYRDLANPPTFEPREKIWNNQISFEHENPELVGINPTYPIVPGYQNPVRVDPRQLMARHLYCLAMFLRDQSNAATNNYDYNNDDSSGDASNDDDMARMIAQWAVNVVDFRDADSICTGFEYDVNPLNGWDVDGDLATDSSSMPPDGISQASGQNERGVVWGVERPELVIAETLAWHDRRTEDLSDADTGGMGMDTTVGDPMNPDTDYDQQLQPHGALFIELFNPWFDRSGGSYDHKRPEFSNGPGPLNGVELNRTNTGGSPVWRLLIVKENVRGDDPDFDPSDPESGPERWTLNPPANNDVERSVYFVPQTSQGTPGFPTAGHGTPFFLPASLSQNPAPILPGRYAVVGGYDEEVPQGGGQPPHYISYAGRRTDAIRMATTADLNLGQTRRIELRPQNNPNVGQLRVFDNSRPYANDPQDNDFDINDVQATIAIPIQNLSASEPPNGYPGVVGASVFDPAAATGDGEGAYVPPIDVPLDDADQALRENRSTSGYRRVFLQRLANPLLAWDSQMNPYITVDASDIDITAFNGIVDDSSDPRANTGGFSSFQSFQRGGRWPQQNPPPQPPNPAPPDAFDSGYPEPPPGYRNLWTQTRWNSATPTVDSPPEGNMGMVMIGPHYFPYQLYHTLGYLNRRYWPFFTNSAGPNQITNPAYGALIGAPANTNEYGAPNAPAFPWLTHLDRPYTSPMELLMVPVASQSRLLQMFNISSPATQDLYSLPWAPNNPNLPYAHLLNFFHSRTSGMPPHTPEGPALYRIFDYLEVPSPYAETERVYNPQFFSSANGTVPTYRPPFSRQTHFRDPGKININTIYDLRVWEALVKHYPEFDPTINPPPLNQPTLLDRLMLGRQGFGSQPADLLQHQAAYPSLFSNPFRSANAADLVPIQSIQPIGPNATLLRGDPLTPSKPALVREVASTTPAAHDDPARNPYFRYQGLQKVANSITTHSNVFAIWVTVGYFEVEPNPPTPPNQTGVDRAHPDGYRLGQEIGADAGQANRARMFFIVDRSVPVAYENGKRHNTDKAVLLRRYIE